MTIAAMRRSVIAALRASTLEGLFACNLVSSCFFGRLHTPSRQRQTLPSLSRSFARAAELPENRTKVLPVLAIVVLSLRAS